MAGTRAQRASVARVAFVRVAMAESGASTACTEPEHRRPELRDVKYETKDWRWLLWDSDVAREKIHPELGARWTAVLQDALHAADPPPSPVSRRMPRTSASATVGVLKWAREHGCPWDEKTCYCAAMEGNLDVLKYAHENGCPWDEWTCSNAAKGGHMNVLEYAHENGCPWEEFTCYSAAKGGHLDVLKYLHNNKCPWDRHTCHSAAEGGHLDVLKYLHENGCPWNKETCLKAASGCHLDVLKYARENGCPWNRQRCLESGKGFKHHPKHAQMKAWIQSQPD